jgi:hypothetical protein
MLPGQNSTSVHLGFFFFPLLKRWHSLSRSDQLKVRSEKSQWKGKFVFKPPKGFWLGHPLVSPKGWRCKFLTCPEAPKAAKSWTLPAMSVANTQSDLLCFLHGFCGLRLGVISCFQCSSTAFGQDWPGQQRWSIIPHAWKLFFPPTLSLSFPFRGQFRMSVRLPTLL